MKWFKRLLPVCLAAALIAFLLWQVHPVEVVRMVVGIDWRWLVVGLAIYAVTNLVRAFRFGALLKLPSAWRFWPESFALSFLNNTLPGRVGEASYPYFMWRRHNVSVGESSASLVVVRILDYAAVAALYVLFAAINLHRLTPGAAATLRIVAGFLLVSLALLLATPWVGNRLLDGLAYLLDKVGLRERRLAKMLLRFGRQVVMAMREMASLRLFFPAVAWSLLAWVGTFAWFAACMRGLGVELPFTLVIVGATFAVLAKAIPFITVGGFGAHEAGWTVGFTLVGIATSQAIATGFAVNVLTLLASAIFGGASLALMALQTGVPWFHRARVLPSSASGPGAQIP